MSSDILSRVFFGEMAESVSTHRIVPVYQRGPEVTRRPVAVTLLEEAQILLQRDLINRDWKENSLYTNLTTAIAEAFPQDVPVYYEDDTSQMRVYEIRSLNSAGVSYSKLLVTQFMKAEARQVWYRADYLGPARASRSFKEWEDFSEVIELATPIPEIQLFAALRETFDIKSEWAV